MELNGKVAIVTGAAQGIGVEIAALLAQRGATVVLADIDERAVAAATRIGPKAVFVRLDVTSESSWTDLTKQVMERFRRINILVNNAGIFSGSTIVETSAEAFERMFRVNQLGVLLGMKSVAPLMEADDNPAIVNISSCVGMRGTTAQTAYAATKWAVRGMTKCAALEFAQQGIRVNSVHPGPIPTGINEDFLKERLEFLLSRIPLRRLGEPKDVAEAVAYFASEGAKYVTGAEISVDGGFAA
jgi:3alpha(or 20beta)-hydroxysteroid dehydrogenase